ncbi:MAG: hypothetical protein V3T33_07965 [Myxococcota bacterium]
MVDLVFMFYSRTVLTALLAAFSALAHASWAASGTGRRRNTINAGERAAAL